MGSAEIHLHTHAKEVTKYLILNKISALAVFTETFIFHFKFLTQRFKMLQQKVVVSLLFHFSLRWELTLQKRDFTKAKLKSRGLHTLQNLIPWDKQIGNVSEQTVHSLYPLPIYCDRNEASLSPSLQCFFIKTDLVCEAGHCVRLIKTSASPGTIYHLQQTILISTWLHVYK